MDAPSENGDVKRRDESVDRPPAQPAEGTAAIVAIAAAVAAVMVKSSLRVEPTPYPVHW